MPLYAFNTWRHIELRDGQLSCNFTKWLQNHPYCRCFGQASGPGWMRHNTLTAYKHNHRLMQQLLDRARAAGCSTSTLLRIRTSSQTERQRQAHLALHLQ